ncbi:hypothetical protein [Legionella sp. 16cNR16C]|uniref:hypothetical protein n=1 Tax=Legionella sp. 16cNR16C TaxID=2905656 RepID=UPI001E518D97|nr:hypothetical protein [Legionella sp. 16cNR16C]MCE3044297.1 hypothetical protein [Legionella sp. 16cNR16C]
MTKKVALVDIDGCLIQDGKLNLALAEKLKAYDEVILFTQRSKYIQTIQANIWRGGDPVTENDILVTPDAVDKLSALLGKQVKVSTSVDRFFNSPLSYYETELKPFEQNLKKALIEQGEDLNLAPFREVVTQEEVVVRQLLAQAPEVNAADFYPKGKVEQFVTLTGALPTILKTDEEIEVDFFDDHPDNLQEIIDHPHLPIKPNCFVVANHHVSTLSSFNKHQSNNISRTEAVIRGEFSDIINNLQSYKQARADEWKKSGSEYGSNWARIFKHEVGSARNKISAVDKAIQILSGVEGVEVSAGELKALKDGRVKEYLGDKINLIESYINEQQNANTRGLSQ